MRFCLLCWFFWFTDRYMTTEEITAQLRHRKYRIAAAIGKTPATTPRELAFRELLRSEMFYVEAMIDFKDKYGSANDLAEAAFQHQ